jgi:hypothetical protein
MTKTFIRVVSNRYVNPGPPGMMPLGTLIEGLFVWNFEFGSLEFVWYLVFGAWNFHDFYYAGNFYKIS